jgi:hypothetical protein
MAFSTSSQLSALYAALIVCTIIPPSSTATSVEGSPVHGVVLVDEGWHPWYEVKKDPESPEKLIICGTKWDPARNTPFGFIVASSDGGASWHGVLEDRSSPWVTEHSCAFGPNHRAYFISEASKVFDGRPHHELGTTRLYVSSDGGEHWMERATTEWADYSTSAVSSVSGRLYTFFNAMTSEPESKRNGHVGLMVFSADGTEITGPFFDSASKARESLYPSDAVTLKNGTVVALYYGARPVLGGLEIELGIVRADPSAEPSLERETISQGIVGKRCVNYREGSLAYDAERNRLFVAYLDGCARTRVMLTTSDDGGKTWTKGLAVSDAKPSEHRIAYPSLVVNSKGVLEVLCEEGRRSGRWLIANIKDGRFIEPPVELSTTPRIPAISNDSLRFWTGGSSERQRTNRDVSLGSSVTLHLEDEAKDVWRGQGLVATIGEGVLAVWPSEEENGMRLCSVLLDPLLSASNYANSTDSQDVLETDVTDQTVILYGGRQHFDSATATLNVCLMLGNRGEKYLKVPIKLKALDVRSGLTTVSILDSSNGVTGSGAIWDISGSVTDRQIAPSNNSNPFCLSFGLQNSPRGRPPHEGSDLLTLRVRVLAARENDSP